jgi:hypothetical protein
VCEEDLGAEDVADAGEDALGHHRLPDPDGPPLQRLPSELGVGVVAQGVGAEPRRDGLDLVGPTRAQAVAPTRSIERSPPVTR